MAERVQMVGDPAHPARLIEGPENIDNPVLAFFVTYWREKCGASTLPLRSSFVPQEVRANLPWVVSKRRQLGLSLRQAAQRVGVDEGTFVRWERGEWKPRISDQAVERFLNTRDTES